MVKSAMCPPKENGCITITNNQEEESHDIDHAKHAL